MDVISCCLRHEKYSWSYPIREEQMLAKQILLHVAKIVHFQKKETFGD